MKLSHADYEKDMIKSQDLADYYWQRKEGIEAEINEALELLSPYYGRMGYSDRLVAFALRITEIAEMAERLAEEF